MVDIVNNKIAYASIAVVAVYLIYLIRSGMLRDIIAPQNMERSHRFLASVIVVTAVLGMATVVISHMTHFNRMYIWLMLAWLAVEVSPGILLKPAKKLDDADHQADDNISPKAN